MKTPAREEKYADIIVSTRIRLARNLNGYPFSGKITTGKAAEIIDAVFDALEKNPETAGKFRVIHMVKLSDEEMSSLRERHLISPELCDKSIPRALILSKDEKTGIMVNEEDHIRLQVIGSGLCLEDCLSKALEIDGILDEKLSYAFSEELGYLTKCPTNLGTGLRASAMLHLPMLTRSGAIYEIVNAAGKLGIEVRGMYGEGSKANGELYQISNQLTLGFTEPEIVERLKEAILKMIETERKLREEALKSSRDRMEDQIWRAAGTLSFSRLISTEEALKLLSELRLGVSLGIVRGPEFESLNQLIDEIEPATIAISGKASDPLSRDRKRAELLRTTLEKKLSKG